MDTRYDLRNLWQCGKRVETKSQTILWETITFDTFGEVRGENLAEGGRFPPSILKRGKNLGGSRIILFWYKKIVQVRKGQGVYTPPTPCTLNRLSCYLQYIAVQTQLFYVRPYKTVYSCLDQYQSSSLISMLPISFLSNAFF